VIYNIFYLTLLFNHIIILLNVPKNTAIEIIERRQTIILLLGEGYKPPEIATKLREDKALIYKDIKAIKKKGSEFLKGINKEELGYFYNILMTNLFHSNKLLWEMTKNEDISDSDKIRAIKTINDITVNLRETVKEGLNLFEIPELKARLEKLESINSTDNSSKGYMNIELPYNKNQIPQ
jgi:hypothetical protein